MSTRGAGAWGLDTETPSFYQPVRPPRTVGRNPQFRPFRAALACASACAMSAIGRVDGQRTLEVRSRRRVIRPACAAMSPGCSGPSRWSGSIASDRSSARCASGIRPAHRQRAAQVAECRRILRRALHDTSSNCAIASGRPPRREQRVAEVVARGQIVGREPHDALRTRPIASATRPAASSAVPRLLRAAGSIGPCRERQPCRWRNRLVVAPGGLAAARPGSRARRSRLGTCAAVARHERFLQQRAVFTTIGQHLQSRGATSHRRRGCRRRRAAVACWGSARWPRELS